MLLSCPQQSLGFLASKQLLGLGSPTSSLSVLLRRLASILHHFPGSLAAPLSACPLSLSQHQLPSSLTTLDGRNAPAGKAASMLSLSADGCPTRRFRILVSVRRTRVVSRGSRMATAERRVAKLCAMSAVTLELGLDAEEVAGAAAEAAGAGAMGVSSAILPLDRSC